MRRPSDLATDAAGALRGALRRPKADPMTDRRPAAPDNETSRSSDWQRLDTMLDEAGRQSCPASDPPALMVDNGPRARAEANDHGGSSGRK